MRALPRMEIGRQVWRRVARELDRVAPAEGLAVPLLALTPRDVQRNPCTTLRLEDLEVVTIARAVLVPPELQRNHLMSVRALGSADERVNREVVGLGLRYPRLRPAGHLHSHPFARGNTWPSSGLSGDIDGHMRPLLVHNSDAGVEVSFSFIACRDQTGQSWVLQAFSLDGSGQVHDLGPCQVVEDEALIARGLFTPGTERQPLLRGLWQCWVRDLRRQGWACRCATLLEGWQRCIVEMGQGLCAVFLLPIDFPDRPCQVHVVMAGSSRSERFFTPHLRSLDTDAWVRVALEVEVACRAAA
ncbi:MAG: hypothetical protein ABIJ09_04235 [Pseudomonadota bacterium]